DARLAATTKEPAAARAEAAELRKDVRTADELRAALQRKSRKTRLYLTQDIDLSPGEPADMGERALGLVVEGTTDSQMVSEPKEPDQRRVLKLKYDADFRGGGGAPDWTALAGKAGRVTLKNL